MVDVLYDANGKEQSSTFAAFILLFMKLFMRAFTNTVPMVALARTNTLLSINILEVYHTNAQHCVLLIDVLEYRALGRKRCSWLFSLHNLSFWGNILTFFISFLTVCARLGQRAE